MRRSALALLLVLTASARPARASWPPPATATRDDLKNPANWPNDPGFASDWFLWGFTPDAVQANPLVPDYEKVAGVGMGVDRAWQLSIGDPHIVIAEMDSGYNWGEPDLLNKWFLNRGELPPPNRTDCVGTDPYDCNNDGVFNIQDYTTATGHQQPTADKIADRTLLARADHGDANGNGFLDPQDLIAAFSDGKDDDHNGFVDDICGWDFMWDDNDPMEDTENGGHEGQGGSHGTGEASDSSGEVNNGIDGEGVCPNCLVMPVRVGDSYTCDTNHFALATYYSVARGASLIQEALGALTNPALAQDAVDYAYAHDVLVVASAADETSMHHNYPANLERTLVVHAVEYDGDGWDKANTTTFLNFNNCTNYGGHLALSSPGKSCSSQATGLSSGQAGLVLSYAHQLSLSPGLSAGELYQVMVQSAFDINVPNSASDPTKFPSGPGWDAHFGYGRNDARAALEMVRDGRIPPEVDLSGPRWFEVLDPKRTPKLSVKGSLQARRAPGYDYKLEMARGLEPRDADFQTVSSGTGTAPMQGELGSIDLAALMGDTSAPPSDPHQYAATVRLRVVAHYGGSIGDVQGEARKTFFVHQDDDVRPGFPIYLGASGEGSPRFFDLDHDGKDELVVATASGQLHAFRADGSELPGFPAQLGKLREVNNHGASLLDDSGGKDQGQGVVATPSIGDVDGDGKPEIVVGTLDGELHVVGVDGHEKAGFPVTISDETLRCEAPSVTGANHCRYAGIWNLPGTEDAGPGGLPLTKIDEVERGFLASPVLVDMNGDGKLDIVQAGMDGFVHVWDGTGHELPGFPVEVRDARGSPVDGRFTTQRTRLIDTPAVGDVDGDGKPDILVGSNEVYDDRTTARAYVIRNAGAPSAERFAEAYLPGWPVTLHGLQTEVLPLLGRGVPGSPLMADLDGDGKPELLVHTLTSAAQVYDSSGVLQFQTETSIPSSNTGATSHQDPTLLAISTGSLADLDGDGALEYVDGTVGVLDLEQGAGGGIRHDYDHQLNAWAIGRAAKTNKGRPVSEHIDARMLKAFPQKVPDYQFLMNYAVADVDGDGRPEVISGSGGYEVTGFNSDGKQPPGWPKFTGGWIISTPAVGDLDGDGFLDVAVHTREGFLWVWKTTGPANGNVQWEGFHHDPQGTGNVATALPVRAGPKPQAAQPGPSKKKGCGCDAGASSGASLALALAALGLRRRRVR